MNTCVIRFSFQLALIVCLGLILADWATAQSFTILHNFSGYPNDGDSPYASLTLSGNTLYGTTESGGSSPPGLGTVFKINTDGNGYTVLNDFSNANHVAFGQKPRAGLTVSGGKLYGTASQGGGASSGTVFKVNTDGTSLTVIKDFISSVDGGTPYCDLTLSGSTLYGTTHSGGTAGFGNVFKVNTDGSGYTVLKNFTNSPDGADPYAGLTLSGNTLYGTTHNGGNSSGHGTVFKINTDGSGYTVLRKFENSFDGHLPFAGLTLSGTDLYGTTEAAGTFGNTFGTVFKINTNGSGYTVLKSFTNIEGVDPRAGVTISGNTLYGTTHQGGSSGFGTVFKINTDGSGFTVLKNFTGSPDGANPQAALTISGTTLYGTTLNGGSFNLGAVFSLSLAPPLKITLSGMNVVLTWPTNWSGFTLQSTTNLAPSAWFAVAPLPVVVSGQNAVTNPISRAQQFYRLSQ